MTGRLAFNTDALPEHDRFPAFCEEIIRRYAALDISPRGDGLFRAVIDMQRAGPVAVSSRFSTPADYVRSPRFVSDGNDSIFIVLCGVAAPIRTSLGLPRDSIAVTPCYWTADIPGASTSRPIRRSIV